MRAAFPIEEECMKENGLRENGLKEKKRKKVELLAPAGNREAFYGAMRMLCILAEISSVPGLMQIILPQSLW